MIVTLTTLSYREHCNAALVLRQYNPHVLQSTRITIHTYYNPHVLLATTQLTLLTSAQQHLKHYSSAATEQRPGKRAEVHASAGVTGQGDCKLVQPDMATGECSIGQTTCQSMALVPSTYLPRKCMKAVLLSPHHGAQANCALVFRLCCSDIGPSKGASAPARPDERWPAPHVTACKASASVRPKEPAGLPSDTRANAYRQLASWKDATVWHRSTDVSNHISATGCTMPSRQLWLLFMPFRRWNPWMTCRT